MEVNRGKIAEETPILAKKDGSMLSFVLDCTQVQGRDISLHIGPAGADYQLYADEKQVKGRITDSGETEFAICATAPSVRVLLKKKRRIPAECKN